ncbi:XdhC family protein [Amycolatopsis cynarae]|uniref:XdhC family protein n=1 Tax=Amycolatopsis cynarae TaxID=2995223 RepID=A0ABY7AX67_9PSEU|nr:XdhC family protein [Amycolatopsis sp. HUAS 11-8]WAL63502.1 XdhC family protein [Amycolatopsis sp. HUAS 11-8]
MSDTDAACAVAHGEAAPEPEQRTLVVVFRTPVAGFLLRYGADLGYRTLLFEPDGGGAGELDLPAGTGVVDRLPALDATADVVVSSHHRGELGTALRDVLAHPVRWVGVMGNPRQEGPHVAALRELGVPEAEIGRVHRPIGLNIGSRTPPEIAVAVLAGLLADRNGRHGGFEFAA